MPSIAESLGGTQNKAWAEDKSTFAFKMMRKMGWDEGKGLGKNNDGMLTHVRLKKRVEEIGLGSEVEDARNKNFMGQQDDYNSLLASLAADHVCVSDIVKKKARKGKKSKKSKKSKKEKKPPSTQPKQFRPTRFINNKNVSMYSEEDKAALFGKSKKDTIFEDLYQANISAKAAAKSVDSGSDAKIEKKAKKRKRGEGGDKKKLKKAKSNDDK